MNREIKFRAWQIEFKKMFEVYQLFLNGNPCNGVWINENTLENKNRAYGYIGKNIILMQYTGLKDKHGKEIFEGDVVLLTDLSSRKHPYKCEIMWNDIVTGFEAFTKELGFGLTIHDKIDRSKFIEPLRSMLSMEREIEIIGNIYENPELLTNK